MVAESARGGSEPRRSEICFAAVACAAAEPVANCDNGLVAAPLNETARYASTSWASVDTDEVSVNVAFSTDSRADRRPSSSFCTLDEITADRARARTTTTSKRVDAPLAATRTAIERRPTRSRAPAIRIEPATRRASVGYGPPDP